jgi:hypothetical protein
LRGVFRSRGDGAPDSSRTPEPTTVSVKEPIVIPGRGPLASIPDLDWGSPSMVPPAARKHGRIGVLGVLIGTLVVLVAFALRGDDRVAHLKTKLASVSAAIPVDHWISVLLMRPEPKEEPLVAAAPIEAPEEEAADAHLDRSNYASIPGGVLFFPKTFSSKDGTYDLYLHFHGNTRVVEESAEHAGLNALVAVVNLGINSAPYQDGYAVPGTYEGLLGSIDRQAGVKGLKNPHVRRIALSSWSGGYGALSTILEQRKGTDPLDSIVVLDGIHCGFLDGGPRGLNSRLLMPFEAAAKKAAKGDWFFTITHSEIDPIEYAGTELTSSYLLDVVGGKRGPGSPAPEHVSLKAAEGAVSKKLEKHMEPTTEARVGSFHVRGYKGNTPEHHMAHLLQMASTVMPEIVERWKTVPSAK